MYGVQARAEELADHEDHCMLQGSRTSVTNGTCMVCRHELRSWQAMRSTACYRVQEIKVQEIECLIA